MPDYRLAARRAARKYGLNPTLFERQIGAESGFNPNAGSPAGAQGIAQFMPATARSVGVNLSDNRVTDDLEGAARLMSSYVKKYGNYRNALVAYNAGPGRVGKPLYAETAGYVQKILRGGNPRGTSRPSSSPSPESGGLAATLTVQPGQSANGFDPGAPSPLGQVLEQRTAPPPIVVPDAPNSAQRYLSAAGQAPVLSAPAPQASPLADLLAGIGAVEGLPSLPQGQSSPKVNMDLQGAPASGGGDSGRQTGRVLPTARRGQLIGSPHSGTHTLGDWQSDNAVDVKVPEGTRMVALQDGVVVKVRKHPQDGGRFAGDQITIRGKNGNQYFYAHGVAGVKAGQRVKRGQSLGVTGSANGVPHLHFGQQRGDPRQRFG